jgi:hypothetical protein
MPSLMRVRHVRRIADDREVQSFAMTYVAADYVAAVDGDA